MHIETTMVQTKAGTKSNAWIEYMRLCAKHYKEGKSVPTVVKGKKHCTDKAEKLVEESKKEAEDFHKRAVRQQTEAAVKHAQAAEGEMKSIQRREKAQQDQEKATTAVAKKRHKAVAKKIQG